VTPLPAGLLAARGNTGDENAETASSAAAPPTGLPALLPYVYRAAFEPIPERAPGMGSERIAEVLRFRARLPPLVTVAHVVAVSRSATEAEREMARLVAKGEVRRVRLVGRGSGRGGGEGEGLVRTEDWVFCVEERKGEVGEELAGMWNSLMDVREGDDMDGDLSMCQLAIYKTAVGVCTTLMNIYRKVSCAPPPCATITSASPLLGC
jgi:hypothetical protein